ncbi:MAG: bifunctional adenosylcobinamide kinase/adenosylcobinamide-phosphate guanylyltransferase [Oscillospiraceae bacterium]|nr:bifunctional adenosylcobinamide kinase/adenosylcobinamide-phosphate guanylyltransferase [Oscillospiraceae bacterium]
MSKNILITGGAASGKSRWAVTNFSACDYVLYLRAGDAVDSDTLNRINYGNEKNGVEWDIVTGAVNDPVQYFTDHKFVIFDSLSSYTSIIINEMCADPANMDEDTKKSIEKRVIADVTSMQERINEISGSMIIITLETGFSVTPENRAQAIFREILGNVNQRIANMSDEVYFSASGIQFKIK